LPKIQLNIYFLLVSQPTYLKTNKYTLQSRAVDI